ncbi:hypothetical protein [Paludibacterium yongneupense]|uniref:hypothetical protein n=1 Tax=Paludibacterium yongneupense TaxID=400061 RepID=UPI00048EF021|nr:hypothetical protein [Paludibacterium yongneupense]
MPRFLLFHSSSLIKILNHGAKKQDKQQAIFAVTNNFEAVAQECHGKWLPTGRQITVRAFFIASMWNSSLSLDVPWFKILKSVIYCLHGILSRSKVIWMLQAA